MRLWLLAIMLLTGCESDLCLGHVVKDGDIWDGPLILSPRTSGAGGIALLSWISEGLHTAVIEDNTVLGRFDPDVPRTVDDAALASAPTGHVLVSRHGEATFALSFDREGGLLPGTIPLAGTPSCAPATTFDGTRFLIAFCERDALMLTSLVPGASTPPMPVAIGSSPGGVLAMATGGGVTWIVWRKTHTVEGVRIRDGAAVDTTPLVLIDDRRLNGAGGPTIASSAGQFLLAVDANLGSGGGSLLVPVFPDAATGPVVELPSPRMDLTGDAAGYAAVTGRGTKAFASGKGVSVVHLELDGTLVSETKPTASDAALAFDGIQFVIALRRDDSLTDRDLGASMLSFGSLASLSRIKIAETKLERIEVTHCEQTMKGYQ